MKAQNKFATLIVLSAAGVLLAVSSGCSKDTEKSGHLGPIIHNYIGYYINPAELFLGFGIKAQGDKDISTVPVEFSDIILHIQLFPTVDQDYCGKTYSVEEVYRYRDEHFIRWTPKSTDEVIYDEPYNPEFNRLYDSLSTAHKDTEYSKVQKHYNGQQFAYPTVFRRMKLDVVSDVDYDAAHPAGTPLNDILNLAAPSAAEIIESGYDFEKYPFNNDKKFGYVIHKSLAQFNDEYRKLVGGWFRIGLVKAPDATAVHRFTVTYSDEDGRTFSSVTSPIKIKAAM